MGDMGDLYRDMKEARKALRSKWGVECPTCKVKTPKSNPSILLPDQRCKVDGYRDPRDRLTTEQKNEAYTAAGFDIREVEQFNGGSTPVKVKP